MLRQSSFDQSRDVAGTVAHFPKTVGNLQTLHEPGDAIRERLPGILRPDLRNVDTERFGCYQVAIGPGASGEAKDSRRVQNYRDAVRHQRTLNRVAGSVVRLDMARHGIRHAVRQMDARVTEADARV